MNSNRSNPFRRPTPSAQGAQGAQGAGGDQGAPATDPVSFPHESLDVHQVLCSAYQAIVSWPISFARGSTGDQLKRAAGSALLRYAEGFYAQGGCQTAHWIAARASCGEAGAAAMQLGLERQVGSSDIAAVRQLLVRAMSMLHRLSRRS